MILAVHDASDVFLEIGKLTKYSVLEIVPSISFILFAIIMACLAPHHLPLRDHKEYKVCISFVPFKLCNGS